MSTSYGGKVREKARRERQMPIMDLASPQSLGLTKVMHEGFPLVGKLWPMYHQRLSMSLSPLIQTFPPENLPSSCIRLFCKMNPTLYKIKRYTTYGHLHQLCGCHSLDASSKKWRNICSSVYQPRKTAKITINIYGKPTQWSLSLLQSFYHTISLK